MLALEAGKHVLVEKPLALNVHQALEIAQLAERRGLFCMEGLWTFSLPRYDVSGSCWPPECSVSCAR